MTNFTNLDSKQNFLKSAPASSILEKAFLIFIWLKDNYAIKKINFDHSKEIAEHLKTTLSSF